MIVECWEAPYGTEITLASPEDALKLCAPYGHQLRYSIRADTWDEVMRAHHEIQGWEPYKPIPE